MTLLTRIQRWLNGWCEKHQREHEILKPGQMGAETAECPECAVRRQ
jgi:hypothetical protein